MKKIIIVMGILSVIFHANAKGNNEINNEQINISGFKRGVYVLVLKENGNIVAQSKVQI